VHYTAIPAPITAETQALTIPDKAEEALTHYVMFRALSKNAEFASSPEAEKYLALFNAAIGANVSAQQAASAQQPAQQPAQQVST
jgi:hypothetical protein